MSKKPFNTEEIVRLKKITAATEEHSKDELLYLSPEREKELEDEYSSLSTIFELSGKNDDLIWYAFFKKTEDTIEAIKSALTEYSTSYDDRMTLYDLLPNLIAKVGSKPGEYDSPITKKIIGSFRDELDIVMPWINPITSEYLRSLGHEDSFATPLFPKTTVANSIIDKVLQKIYTNVSERETLRETLSECLYTVIKNPLIYKILEVMSVIDIPIYAVRSNVVHTIYGRYGKGVIQVFNTEELTETTSGFKADVRVAGYCNTLIHECAHAVLDRMFDNQCKPFLENDTVSESCFEGIKDQIVKLPPKLDYTPTLLGVYNPVFHNQTKKVLLDAEFVYHLTNIQVMDETYYGLREMVFFNNITIVLEYLLESENYPMVFHKQTEEDYRLVDNLLDDYTLEILTEITTSGDSLTEVTGEKSWNNEIRFPNKIIGIISDYLVSYDIIPLGPDGNFTEMPLTLKAPAIDHHLLGYSQENFIAEIPAHLTGILANKLMLKHFSGQNAEELVFEDDELTKNQDLMDFMTKVVISQAGNFLAEYDGGSNPSLPTSIEVMGEDS